MLVHAEQTDTPVRVLTVDDQPGFRDAARAVVSATPGFQVVGEAEDGAGALAAVTELRPALVILDVRMPDMGGLEVARRIHDADPDAVVLLVSAHALPDGAETARECGACAFLPKELVRPSALRRVWEAHGPADG